MEKRPKQARRPRITSLRGRLTLLLALATLITLGSAAWVVDWRADSEMQQRFDSVLLARAQAFAAFTRFEDGKVEFTSSNEGAPIFPGSGRSWYELRCAGREVARTSLLPPRISVGAQPHFADAFQHDDFVLRVVALRFIPALDNGGDDDGSGAATSAPVCNLRYAVDRDPLDDLLATLDWILLGSIFGACALVLLLTPLLVRRGLRPLSALAGAMADIGPDAPSRRLPDSGTRELAPLVARFNDVLARMDAGLARERDFAAGLAHELRTRLAELRTLVEVETRYPSDRNARDLLGEVGLIGAELEATVTALLQLTRIESGLARVDREPVAILPLLARARSRHAVLAIGRNIRVQIAVKSDAVLAADPALIEIIFDNLIGNAVAYSPAGSAVLLEARPYCLEVINPAPALHKDDLLNFGQRFWRKDESGSSHAGLGLALAAASARVQHMTMRFTLDETHRLHAVLDWSAVAGSS